MSRFFGQLVPPDRAVRRFVLSTLVESIGSGMSLTASVLFLTRWAGLTSGQIGIGMSLAAALALLSSVPLAVTAERFGIVRALVLVQVWRGLWFLAYLVVRSFPMYLVVCCMLGVALRVVTPLTQSVVAAVTTESDRVRTMALMRSVQNAGFGLGAFAGTLVIGTGSTTGLAGVIVFNAVAFFVAAVLLWRLPLRNAPATAVRRTVGWRQLRSLRDGGYLLLTALSGILALHMTLLTVGLPLWVVVHTDAPSAVVGLALFANTVLVVLLQVRASRGCDDVRVAARRLVWSGAAMTAFCVLLAGSGLAPAGLATIAVLLAAIAITLAELWHSAGAWGISFELAPPERRTEYLAVFNLGLILQGIAGPIVLTALVLPGGAVGWGLLAVFFLLVATVVPTVVRRVGLPGSSTRQAALELPRVS